MIDQAIFNYINTFVLSAPIHYGSAEGESLPYYVMTKLYDPERPNTLCVDQGESGETLFEFQGFCGGHGAAATAGTTLYFVEQLKLIVKNIRGEIGIAPNRYRVWWNETRGVNLVGQQDEFTWTAQFESVLRWEKI